MTDTTPSPAPLRFALVPIEATPQMLESAGTMAGWSGSVHMADVEHSDWYEDIVAASPGNDLLQRIVRALNLGSTSLRNDGYIYAADGFDEILT